MANDFVTVEGFNSALMLLAATQAPAPPDGYLEKAVTPFEARPTTPDEEGSRAYRNLLGLGFSHEWNQLTADFPDRAEEVKAYADRLRAWRSRWDGHVAECRDAARYRWRVEWAARLLSEVHLWERRAR